MNCYNCDTELNFHIAQGNAPAVPKPGDYMVCLHCRFVNVLGEDYELRQATEMERAQFIQLHERIH